MMEPRGQPPSAPSQPSGTTAPWQGPLIPFLRRYAPFDQMDREPLAFLAEHLRLGFYAKDQVILSPDQGPVQHLYIIKQGRVRGEMAPGDTSMANVAWELTVGECFPVGAMLAQRPTYATHRAVEDSFCLELERRDFNQVLNMSPVFREFVTRRMAALLDTSMRRLQGSFATQVADDISLNAALHTLIRRAPIVCPADTSIREVLEVMDRERIGSMVVVDAFQAPLGVFTLHDLLSRIALPGLGLERPIREVMTTDPMTLPAGRPAYEAALLMANHGFGHMLVVDDADRLCGILSERDLFSLQRIGLVNLSRRISNATDIGQLKASKQDITRLIDQLLAQGASVDQLGLVISALNDQITRRLLQLCLEQNDHPEADFTWLVFGSGARQEQTLRTDQDNGLLFRVPAGQDADSLRRQFLPIAGRINQVLADCGFDLCKGNIMAGNPECCLSLEEWQERFAQWIAQGIPRHLLKSTIFFDIRPLYGDPEPAERLQQWVIERAQGNRRFLRQMAENALRTQPPLGLVRDFIVSNGSDYPHTLHLKLQGITPFVDGARLLAIANGLSHTNTRARFQAVAQLGVIPQEEADAWCDACAFIQLQRMRLHQSQLRQGRPLDNRLDPDSLNELDRRILKEAFRQARKLQSRIALDYQIHL